METPRASPFRDAALSFWDAGLCPIPCGGEAGKRPLLSTKNWHQRPLREAVRSWTADARFDGANVGLLTGLSGLTVVDIDDPSALPDLLHRFGPTPIMVSTPSGGMHLWYRAAGERCTDLRRHGFTADVKGVGGFVVAPPSIRPTDGRRYQFDAGGQARVDHLPRVAPAATEWLASIAGGVPGRKFLPGHRNTQLFKQALGLVRGCEDLEELIEELIATNRLTCDPPLPNEEVVRTAQSAWRYQILGRNFAGGGGFSCSAELRRRIGDPDALWLYAILMEAHAAKVPTGASFAISAKARALPGVAAPLSAMRIRKARDRLIAVGVLQQTYAGGRRKGDTSQYRFDDLT
jgi:hypothetical protein